MNTIMKASKNFDRNIIVMIRMCLCKPSFIHSVHVYQQKNSELLNLYFLFINHKGPNYHLICNINTIESQTYFAGKCPKLGVPASAFVFNQKHSVSVYSFFR